MQMDSRVRDEVIIINDSQKRTFLLENGRLELETLKRYFPGATGLSFKRKDSV